MENIIKADITYISAAILYIGCVAEKGRCYTKLRGIRYKHLLKKHICILYRFSELLYKDNFEDTENIWNDFLNLCKREKEIGKFYTFSEEVFGSSFDFVSPNQYSDDYKRINKIIYLLMSELKNEVSRINPDKKKVYNLLNSLHNLPRVYFVY